MQKKLHNWHRASTQSEGFEPKKNNNIEASRLMTFSRSTLSAFVMTLNLSVVQGFRSFSVFLLWAMRLLSSHSDLVPLSSLTVQSYEKNSARSRMRNVNKFPKAKIPFFLQSESKVGFQIESNCFDNFFEFSPMKLVR